MSKKKSNTYWFISVPAEGKKTVVLENLKSKLPADLAEVDQFIIPEFKIGTLDALVVISDELVKYDQYFESAVMRIVDILRNLKDDINNNLVVNDKSVDQYLKTFQWDTMKFRADKSMQEIAEILNQEVTRIDNTMKSKLSSYNQVKGNLQALERKQTNIADVVKKEHFVVDSNWLNKYETLVQFVVPRSSQKIAEDEEYGLFTVTLFKRVSEDFRHKCREEKFVVREFQYNENEMANQRKEFEEVGATEKELYNSLLRLSSANFGEVFSAWIHLKALRVYVESVLRYGLPPDFMSAMIKPKYKMEKKIREVLIVQYGKLGGTLGKDASKDIIEEYHNLVDTDYYPYVWFQIKFDVFK
ncbi:6171_t:CDS:10 [Diversispora eburnea]|uniref:V-type proton ATPase subunit C n=1 Tax=Diversispora eburnea TaxID=1213867 RepID=A0A9N8WFZ0_9GLOM|nr:6171_t:CDS:10 [Diversispora eburnea]